MVLQAVGRRVEVTVGERWGDRPVRSQIVAIGAAEALDEGALADLFDRCLA